MIGGRLARIQVFVLVFHVLTVGAPLHCRDYFIVSLIYHAITIEVIFPFEFKQPKALYHITRHPRLSQMSEGDRALQRDWRKEIHQAFEVITPRLPVFVGGHTHCSTHVHFSFEGSTGIPLAKAKLISIAAIYFENSIRALMPEPWRDRTYRRQYVQSNMKDYFWFESGGERIDMCQAWTLINQQESMEHLEILVCNPSEAWLGDGKYYKWNFGGVGNNETIEFRQGPASLSAVDTIDWIDFVHAFVQAACAVDPIRLDSAASYNDWEMFHAAFGMGGLQLYDRPEENVCHIQAFLQGQGLRKEFWDGRLEFRNWYNFKLANLDPDQQTF